MTKGIQNQLEKQTATLRLSMKEIKADTIESIQNNHTVTAIKLNLIRVSNNDITHLVEVLAQHSTITNIDFSNSSLNSKAIITQNFLFKY